MHTPAEVVKSYVASAGGVRKGERTLTPDFALRVERASQGRINKAALIWGAAA